LNLPPGLRARNGKLYYRFQVAGAQYSGPTGCEATARGLTRAIRKLERSRQLVESGQADQLKLVPKPFNDAVKLFCDWADGEYREHPSTAERMQTSMVSLEAFFARIPIHAITPGQIEDYKAWRRSCGIRDVTLRHDLHALSKLYQYAQKHHWVLRNTVREVSIPSDREAVRQHVLSAEEEALYFGSLVPGTTIADAARMVLYTGMRPSEVVGLAKEDVDLAGGTVMVRRGKTRAARRLLALAEPALEIVRRRMQRKGDWLFPGRGALAVARLNSAHDRALKAINEPREGPRPRRPLSFVIYDLRHTFATRTAEAGCPLPLLASILGHASLRTIGRYVHPTQDAQERAMLQYTAWAKIGPTCCPKQGGFEGFGGNAEEAQTDATRRAN
jgi:integrase